MACSPAKEKMVSPAGLNEFQVQISGPSRARHSLDRTCGAKMKQARQSKFLLNRIFHRQLSTRGGYLEYELRGDRVAIAGQAVTYLRGQIWV